MASRENSKADGKTANELKLLNSQSSQTRMLASLHWNQPPLCWLTAEQQSQLQNQSETLRYNLGEKIWSQEAEFQFLIVSGKVRLRSEGVGKPLATLQVGDWFGDLKKYSVECKAVAASKEVVVVRWNTAVWAELSTPQIEEFWRGSQEQGEIGRWGEEEISPHPHTPTPEHPSSSTPEHQNTPTPEHPYTPTVGLSFCFQLEHSCCVFNNGGATVRKSCATGMGATPTPRTAPEKSDGSSRKVRICAATVAS